MWHWLRLRGVALAPTLMGATSGIAPLEMSGEILLAPCRVMHAARVTLHHRSCNVTQYIVSSKNNNQASGNEQFFQHNESLLYFITYNKITLAPASMQLNLHTSLHKSGIDS